MTRDEIPADLEQLARSANKWPGGLKSGDVLQDGSGAYFYVSEEVGDWTESDWLQARQLLGLESPEVTEAEDEAWEAMEKKRSAESFLRQAAELMKERGKQYDQDGGERSMGKTVEAFNAITGRDLSESEGWLLMGLLKSVRQYSGDYHRDSAEDKVAYAALEAESLEASALRAGELGE